MQRHGCLKGITLVLATGLLAGCATPGNRPPAGGQIAYHVFNRTNAPRIMMPSLTDAGSGVRLYANLHASHPGQDLGRSGSWVWAESAGAQSSSVQTTVSFDAFGQRLPASVSSSRFFGRASASETVMLPRPAAGAFQASPDQHRLPGAVILSWRVPALPGQQRLNGDLRGPFRLALRAAIPSPVLGRLTQSSSHRLEVAVGASPDSPVIVWRLINRIDDGFAVLARGSVDAPRLVSPDPSQE